MQVTAPSAGLGVEVEVEVEVEAGKESLGFVALDEAGEVLGEGGLRPGLLGFGILRAH